VRGGREHDRPHLGGVPVACEGGAGELAYAEELDVHIEDLVGLLSDALHCRLIAG